MQVTESFTERDLLFGRDVLIPEKDHEVIEERLLNLGECFFVQFLGEVHTADFGPERPGDRALVYFFECHLELP
jgi:hypothetical protein